MLENKDIDLMLNIENIRGYKPPSRFFCIEELVHPDILKKEGEARCWERLDFNMLLMITKLRIRLNIPLIINTYHRGGYRKYSGLRPPPCSPAPEGSPKQKCLTEKELKYKSFSMHIFGKAYDIVSKDMSAEEMRKHILENQDFYNYITYIEDNVDWLHIDGRNSTFDKIHLFKV